ncbi:MAG: lysophospholipase [Deltaproteobacteria bacterium]|nr:lysophospholipase [Deltaproteobacteria bacterium]
MKPGLVDHIPVEAWLKDSRGRSMAFSAYPAAHPWLQVLICHGFGEHRGWWHHVAEAFQKEGVTVFSFDNFHHGVSDGAPSDVADYNHLADGVLLAMHQGVAPRRVKGVGLVVLGHSNGALAALLASPRFAPGEVSAMVICSPLLGLSPLATFGGGAAARLLYKIDPAIRIRLHRDLKENTRNQAIWEDFSRDPLRFQHISVRFFIEMARAARQARETITLPGMAVLLLGGGKDKVVHRKHYLRWYQRLESPDKKLIEYPQMVHELFNEPDWLEVFYDTLEWLRDRFQTAPQTPPGPKPATEKTPRKSRKKAGKPATAQAQTKAHTEAKPKSKPTAGFKKKPSHQKGAP